MPLANSWIKYFRNKDLIVNWSIIQACQNMAGAMEGPFKKVWQNPKRNGMSVNNVDYISSFKAEARHNARDLRGDYSWP